MKKTYLITASILALTACKDDAPAQVETHTTPNGWSYQFIEVPDAHGLEISIGAPSNWHYVEKNPLIAQMGNHLLQVSGYGDVLPVDKMAMMENIESYAETADFTDTYWLFAYVVKDELDKVMPIFSGTINNPKFDTDEFLKIQEGYRNHFAEQATQSSGQAFTLLSSELFAGTPFLNGTSNYNVANVDAVQISDIENWFAKLPEVGGWKIGVAGNEDPETIEAYIDDILSKFDPNTDAKQLPEWEPNFSGRSIWLERTDIEKSLLQFNAPWPENKSNLDEEISHIAGQAIGGGDQSILFQLIREKLRASYGMQAGIDSFDNAHNIFSISGEVDPSKQAEVISVIDEMLKDIKANGISEEAFSAVKEEMLLFIEETQKDAKEMSYLLATNQLSPYMSDDIYAEVEEIKAMTYESANAAIKERIPSFDQFVKVVVSPNSDGLTPDCALKAVEELAQCEN